MADWGNVRQGLTQGFQVGASTGGRLKGLGSAIAKVAAGLKSKRETGEAIGTLGQTERIKQQIGAEYAGPSKYGPEALAFETAKSGILKPPQAIVDAEGKPIGERPAGSVFKPTDKDVRPEGYKESLADAVGDIEGGKDPMKVYRAMSKIYPIHSSELKRILLPSTKLGEVDISESLWGK